MEKEERETGVSSSCTEFRLGEESYRSMIESANEGIWILDRSLQIAFANPKALQILGYTREEIIGKTPLDFLVEGQKLSVLEMVKEIRKGSTIAHERRFCHKNGTIIWVSVNSAPIHNDCAEQIAYLGMFTDITERKKSEDALRESEEKYQILVEHAGEGIIVVQDHQLKFVNKKMVELTGYSTEDLHSSPFVQFIHPEDRAMVAERYRRRLRGDSLPALYEFRIVQKSGHIRRVKISAVLINWEGRPATLSFITDITEYVIAQEKIHQRELQIRKEREQFTQKLIEAQEEERKRIARELHDDTVPSLALIIMELDKLMENSASITPEGLQRLRRLREETDRTQKEIRRFSHELRPGVLDFLGLEAALESLAEDTNARNSVKVSFEIDGEQQRLPGNVEVAFFRIAQEALNNIRKHSKATQAVIGLTYSPQNIIMSIKDNGQGFNPAAIRKPETEGGLGIVGMRERAQLIGATFNISSGSGQGTEVQVNVARGKLLTNVKANYSQ